MGSGFVEFSVQGLSFRGVLGFRVTYKTQS